MQVDFIPNDKGAFAIDENGERIAEMIVGISGGEMSIYHTGVVERMQGKGIGKQLVTAMADHARQHNLKVMIYCPFVKSIFKLKAEEYADIWDQDKGTAMQGMK
ncbi:GNAT family N-acetyltransferase [Aridibaculum aurantiacum]|uniref:GNAT family N-acetyltransferase n=1 Tax=Aridibaculum aurantiacum TaxID=2810307 RepID=UPI001A9791C4|nr:GNAT family N-acetyltransferase [Aridibaculum aurantiacum]